MRQGESKLKIMLSYLHSSRSLGIAASIVLLPAFAQAQGTIVTSPAQAQTQSSAYWTKERKAAAQPMTLRQRTGAPIPASASVVNRTRTPGMMRGNLPAGAAPHPALAVASVIPGVEKEPALGPGSTVWYNYPPPSTLSVPVLDYLYYPLFPNTALGKLFFSDGSSNYVCSAQSVTSAGTWGAGNRQTVITAGHCCSDGAGTFFRNWMFEPAHLSGTAPFGSWSAQSANVYGAWHTSEDMSRDLCVLQMRKRNGQNINDAVGALGYAWDQPLPQHYTATGWPAQAPFTGGVLYHVNASDAETDTTAAGVFPFTHGIGSAMTGGSSGGGWLLKYQSGVPNNANLFNGLNSYKYTTPNRPAEMFGPYIDAAFITGLFQSVATAPPAP